MIRVDIGAMVLCLLCSSGCGGRAVDLDRPAPAASGGTSSDLVLPSSAKPLVGVWTDAERLYWHEEYGILQSCLKADCPNSTITYRSDPNGWLSPTVAETHVYWLSALSIYSCANKGCANKPVEVTIDPDILSAVSGHRDYVYWSSAYDIYRCPAAGCAATPEVVSRDTHADRLVFDEQRAYWLAPGGSVMSAPLDGSKPPEFVTASQVVTLYDPTAFAIGNGYLYWAVEQQVFRCPLASCASSSTTRLTTGNAPIRELQVDDSGVYWREADAIHSCPLSGCEHSTTLTPARVAQLSIWRVDNGPQSDEPSFALDQSYVYWLETSDPDPANPTPYAGKAIRKTPK